MPRFHTGQRPGRPLLGASPLTERVTGLVSSAIKAKVLAWPKGESAAVRIALERMFAGRRTRRIGRKKPIRKRGGSARSRRFTK